MRGVRRRPLQEELSCPQSEHSQALPELIILGQTRAAWWPSMSPGNVTSQAFMADSSHWVWAIGELHAAPVTLGRLGDSQQDGSG